jgi:hypothetical protein
MATNGAMNGPILRRRSTDRARGSGSMVPHQFDYTISLNSTLSLHLVATKESSRRTFLAINDAGHLAALNCLRRIRYLSVPGGSVPECPKPRTRHPVTRRRRASQRAAALSVEDALSFDPLCPETSRRQCSVRAQPTYPIPVVPPARGREHPGSLARSIGVDGCTGTSDPCHEIGRPPAGSACP